MKRQVKFAVPIIAVIVIFVVYFSVLKPESIKSDPMAPTTQPTYLVVEMYNLIATRFISEPLLLPVDDNESVAVAANGWGNGKFQTSEKSVYKFTSREAAEKFRREKGGAELKITAGDLLKYLCLGQTSPPPTDYWVFIFHRSDEEGIKFISEVCPLPDHDEELVKNVAIRGAESKARKIFGKEGGEFYKFSSQEEAEKFRQDKGLTNLDLNANTLKKLICVEQVRRAEANKTLTRKTVKE